MKSMIRFASIVSLLVLVAGTATAAPVWVDCTPASIGTFASRVHVRCSASVGGGIVFFAVASSDTGFANRYMSLGSSALVAGRTLRIFYDPADTSGSTFGCGTSDCRKAQGIELQ
jgi:arabinogalactan endo-1,4-beta-galactosidase